MDQDENQELFAKQQQQQYQQQYQQQQQQYPPQMQMQQFPQQGQYPQQYQQMPQQYPPQNYAQIPQYQDQDEFNQGEEENSCYASCLDCKGNCQGKCAQITCGICCEIPMKIIKERSVGLKMRFGRFLEEIPPGQHYINPLTERVIVVDKQKQINEYQPFTIITKDNIVATVEASINYRIVNAKAATFKVEYLVNQSGGNTSFRKLELFLQFNTQAAFREICGQRDLQEILEHRDKLNSDIMFKLKQSERQFGIDLESVFVKEIKCDPNVQREIASATAMQRQAKSNIINAEANVKAAQALRTAADSLNSKAGIQMRFLNTLEEVCKKPGARIMFYPKNCESFIQKMRN